MFLYPNAEVTGAASKGVTGEMEITVTKKDGSSQKVHSKLGGDGPFNQASAEGALMKLIQFVEN